MQKRITPLSAKDQWGKKRGKKGERIILKSKIKKRVHIYCVRSLFPCFSFFIKFFNFFLLFSCDVFFSLIYRVYSWNAFMILATPLFLLLCNRQAGEYRRVRHPRWNALVLEEMCGNYIKLNSLLLENYCRIKSGKFDSCLWVRHKLQHK